MSGHRSSLIAVRGARFSLEAPYGVRFLIRSPLLTHHELVELGDLPATSV